MIAGKMGTDRRKAKFLEGPIVAQATGAAGGPIAALPHTVPVVVCMPTLVIQQCLSHVPIHCPPLTLQQWHCLPPHSVPIWHCPLPHTPLCPIRSIACGITEDPGICVASGGGPGCPVDTPATPQTPQFGGPQFGFAAQARAGAGIPMAQPQPASVLTCFSPNPVACNHWQSVLTPCFSVPIWNCPTRPIFCRPSVVHICPTRFEPHSFPVASPFCPVSADCPFGGIDPAGDPRFAAQAQFAGPGMAAAPAAAGPIPVSVVAPCPPLTAPSVCCWTPAPVCHTQIGCPTYFGFHCPSIHQYHCPSVQHWHCPTPLCTDFGPASSRRIRRIVRRLTSYVLTSR